MSVWLVRHAATSTGGRYAGSLDVELSTDGLGQLPEIARQFARREIRLVHCSDRLRAIETARVIRSHPRPDARLRELDFGACEGFTYDEIAQKYPSLADMLITRPERARFPDGESISSLCSRIEAFVSDALGHGDVVVAHAGSLAALLAVLSETNVDFRRTLAPGEAIEIAWHARPTRR